MLKVKGVVKFQSSEIQCQTGHINHQIQHDDRLTVLFFNEIMLKNRRFHSPVLSRKPYLRRAKMTHYLPIYQYQKYLEEKPPTQTLYSKNRCGFCLFCF